MIRLRQPQMKFWDSILPNELLNLPAKLKAIDGYLDDDQFLQPFLARGQQRVGRPTIPMEQYLRFMYLKHQRGLGYETLVQEVSDSITLRRFVRLSISDPVPHSTTISRLTKRFGPEAIANLNRGLVAKLKEDTLVKGRKARTDTTVMEADVEHPTDAGLLADGVRAISQTMKKLRKVGAKVGSELTQGFRDRARSIRGKLMEIGRFLKRRATAGAQEPEQEEVASNESNQGDPEASSEVKKGGPKSRPSKAAKEAMSPVASPKPTREEAKAASKAELRRQVDQLTREAAQIAAQTVTEVKEVAARARRKAAHFSEETRLKVKLLCTQVLVWVTLTQRALDQTKLRLQGIYSIPNRMVSIFDPDARPIRRGKLSAPVEFGYKLELTQIENMIISDYKVHVGNPADVTLAEGVIDRHIEQFGKPMDELAMDRGYYSAANEKMAKDKGVERVCVPKTGRLSQERIQHQAQSWFKELQRWRGGIEGSIGHVKRDFGCDRTKLKGEEGSSTWAGWGVFSHNISKVPGLLAERATRVARAVKARSARIGRTV